MKKVIKVTLRMSLLLVMIIAGFLAFFPQWWDLRDLYQLDQIKQEQKIKTAKRSAALKIQREKKKSALFSPDRFPDTNFLNCLLASNKSRPNQIVNLNCPNQNISDLTGISQLTALTRLNLSDNQLTELDLSHNTKLNQITVQNNSIKKTKLPNANIFTIDLSGNKLTTFSLHAKSRLKSVNLSNNQLSALMITSSTLSQLWADSNHLKSIDLKLLPNLKSLSLGDNQLETLNLEGLTQLKIADLSTNPIHKVSVNHRQRLKSVLISNTQLTNDEILTLRNTVPVVSSTSLSKSVYPDPIFRRCIELHLNAGIASLEKLDCNNDHINLINNSAKIQSVKGIKNLFALKEIALPFQEIQSINVSNLLRLEKLYIHNNHIQHLDIRTNSNLNVLSAAHNNITDLKLQNNNSLESLSVSSNKLKSLDLLQTPNIKALQVGNNEIESLNLDKNQKLKRLLVDNNKLRSLDVSNLQFPTQLSFKNNPLDAESIKKLRQQFWSDHSDLADDVVFFKKPKFPVFKLPKTDFPDELFKKCVEATLRNKQHNTLAEIRRLDCSYQDIINLEGLQLLTGLEYLILQGIDAVNIPLNNHTRLNNILITELPIKTLDLSHLPLLKTIHLSRNQSLRTLILPENNFIERMTAEYNDLHYLRIPDSKSLKSVNLKNNRLKQIDWGKLNQLIKLDLADNQLEQINLRSLTSLQDLIVTKNNLVEIDLSQNLELQELYIPFNQIDTLDLKHNNQIEELMLFNNPLKVPDLTGLTKLKDLALDQSQFNDLVSKNLHLQFDQKPTIAGPVILLSKQIESGKNL